MNNKDNCHKPEFYNIVISGKYIGWTEIHCNNCGKLVAYIDSQIENIDDYYPCMQDECNLLHVHNWIQFFVSMYNDTITNNNDF